MSLTPARTFRQRGCTVIATYPAIANLVEYLAADGSDDYSAGDYAPVALAYVAPTC